MGLLRTLKLPDASSFVSVLLHSFEVEIRVSEHYLVAAAVEPYSLLVSSTAIVSPFSIRRNAISF